MIVMYSLPSEIKARKGRARFPCDSIFSHNRPHLHTQLLLCTCHVMLQLLCQICKSAASLVDQLNVRGRNASRVPYRAIWVLHNSQRQVAICLICVHLCQSPPTYVPPQHTGFLLAHKHSAPYATLHMVRATRDAYMSRLPL